MRWIVIALLVVNIGVFAWFGRTGTSPAPVPEEENREVPALVLLSEAGGSRDLPASGGGSIPATVAAGACFEVGPFPASADAEAFLRAFGGDFVLSLDTRSKQVRHNFRVYLPPYADRAAAETAIAELNRRLAEAGIDFESYIFRQGELANGISLGLFSEQRNAQNVASRLSELGYDVTVSEEPVLQDELWVRVVERNGGATLASRWPQMQAGRTWLQRTEKLC